MDYTVLAADLLERMRELRKAGFQRHLEGHLQGENFVLSYLALQQQYALPSNISKEMNVSTARVTATLNKLEKKGLITRKISTDDRRKVKVEITEKGRKRAESLHCAFLVHAAELLRRLGDDDAKEYLRITGKLAGIIYNQDSISNEQETLNDQKIDKRED